MTDLIAETPARMLLEVKAVLFSEGKPFIFTSGWASPVYLDIPRALHAVEVTRMVVELLLAHQHCLRPHHFSPVRSSFAG